MKLLSCFILFFVCLGALAASAADAVRYRLQLQKNGDLRIEREGTGAWVFAPEFVIQFRDTDPKLAMRPGNVPRVSYNVPTWEVGARGAQALARVKRSTAQAGDGFDDRILDGDTRSRTSDVFAAASGERVRASAWERRADTVHYTFPEADTFSLAATVTLPSEGSSEPILTYVLTPKIGGWFSVGYVGSEAVPVHDAAEFWQPFLWQERRFPHQSFLTPAFECSLPATFVRKGNSIQGVVVDADEFPFQPLPVLENSRFGVVLRNASGEAQPMVFGPVLGGAESYRKAGETFHLKLRFYVGQGDITVAYEEAARRLYQFHDYRSNAITTLNQTLDAMVDYGMSRYSWFIEDLKGCAYSTDVPGAVKNVSALNPLNLALVTDNQEIFDHRAYPILEYLLSREKFLFSLDPKQKIQSPSRALKGPALPVSELAALYGISHGASPVFRTQAERLMGTDRTLNLDDLSPGDSWQNNLRVYQATGEVRFLEKARKGADAYVRDRIEKGADGFNESGLFFWTAFTPKWIDLVELYEATLERRYLEAARLGARRFTQFTWVSPRIPDDTVTVNPQGKVPVYWYLKSKGHLPMTAPEEQVPAWRLSEIGLTPESSGTMSGHRAIFMANHAPWMLRIAALTGDDFLRDVARSAIVGRYRNFPGYHINTARTTIYEKADYPLREHKELSVNSFHYNHIWPHMSILLDYLVTEAFARSGGKIDFPSRFIEGYAYLQSKFYGDRPGQFYGFNDAVLWMPQRLLDPGSVEINYLSARGENRLYLAFTNQSKQGVATEVALDLKRVPSAAKGRYRVKVIQNGQPASEVTMVKGRFPLTVAAEGLTAVMIEGLSVTPAFQQKLLAADRAQAWRKDQAQFTWGEARAMILNFGSEMTTAYVYLQADDSVYSQATLTYSMGGETLSLTDETYPYEFTVPVPKGTKRLSLELSGREVGGRTTRSETVVLEK